VRSSADPEAAWSVLSGLWRHPFRRQNIICWQQVAGAMPPEAQKAGRHASLDMTYLYTLGDAERETSLQQAMFDYLLGLPAAVNQKVTDPIMARRHGGKRC